MPLRKYLTILFALTLALAIACGKGKEVRRRVGARRRRPGPPDGRHQRRRLRQRPRPSRRPSPPMARRSPASSSSKALRRRCPPSRWAPIPIASRSIRRRSTGEDVVVGPGGELANVIVFVKDVPGNYPPPSTPAVLDQNGCKYIPHVTALQVGQPLEIKNNDATLHNVHAMPNVNAQFNEGQPVQGMVSTRKFDKAEIEPFRVKCDVHGWMKSFMVVLPHPFHSVSQMDGTFTIPNLPPGTYTLVAWHEKYGSRNSRSPSVRRSRSR